MKFVQNTKLKIFPFLIILFIAFAMIFSNGLFATKTMATPMEQSIESTLELLNASDAIYLETIDEEECDYLIYYSNSTGCEYQFRTPSGKLASITNIDVIESDSSAVLFSAPLTDLQRQEAVLDYVSYVFTGSMIGQLEIESERASGNDFLYHITEYYDGMETGTSAFVICSPNADVSVCVVRYGSIFVRNEDGSISLANDTPFISEETAIANALDFVEDHATERGCTVQPETATSTLKADEDLQYFEVSVDTYEDDGYVVTYDVWVDVHSGEIQSFQFTQ